MMPKKEKSPVLDAKEISKQTEIERVKDARYLKEAKLKEDKILRAKAKQLIEAAKSGLLPSKDGVLAIGGLENMTFTEQLNLAFFVKVLKSELAALPDNQVLLRFFCCN